MRQEVGAQTILDSMLLVNTQMRTYKDARSFVMKQVTELRNPSSPSRSPLGHLGGNQYPHPSSPPAGGAEFDPWAGGARGGGDKAPEENCGDQNDESLYVFKFKGG